MQQGTLCIGVRAGEFFTGEGSGDAVTTQISDSTYEININSTKNGKDRLERQRRYAFLSIGMGI